MIFSPARAEIESLQPGEFLMLLPVFCIDYQGSAPSTIGELSRIH
jgi:hypothetical protein